MDRFHIIEEAAAIVRSKGVYRQAKVYRRGDALFAGHGAGFIRLSPRGGTSHPNVSWLDIDLPDGLSTSIHGFDLLISGTSMKAVAA